MATKKDSLDQTTETADDATDAPAPKLKNLYVQSIVGPLLDFETNKFIHEPGYHPNTKYLQSQMAAGKIVEANPDA